MDKGKMGAPAPHGGMMVIVTVKTTKAVVVMTMTMVTKQWGGTQSVSCSAAYQCGVLSWSWDLCPHNVCWSACHTTPVSSASLQSASELPTTLSQQWRPLTRWPWHMRYLVLRQYCLVTTDKLTHTSHNCGQWLPSVHINFNSTS